MVYAEGHESGFLSTTPVVIVDPSECMLSVDAP